jgi:hypothetical protein
MPDRDALLILRTELANDRSSLQKVLAKLHRTPDELRPLSPSDPVIAASAFEIHNYYCVCENLMRRIATTFENALDPGRWHQQLLFRMALEIQEVRPALIDAELRGRLDELRKFRHFFRNAYDRPLDPIKVAQNLGNLLAAHEPWLAAVERFDRWVGDLARRLQGPPSAPERGASPPA